MTTTALVAHAFDVGMQQVPEEILSLADFVAALQPRNVMEIGSARGGTFYLWCMLAAPDGLKITIDLPGGAYGGEENADPATRSIRDLRMQSWAPNIHLVAGDSHSIQVRDQVASLLGKEKVDFLFIDGDHTYEGVRADYLMYREFVRASGYIAFHDINDSEFHRASMVGVARLWQELKGTKIEFNVKEYWAGIGLLHHEISTIPSP
jgi:cephalosporin hydroxylase